MRYYLQKKLRLLCRQHKVFFALPSENIFREIEVSLKKDEMVLLRFTRFTTEESPNLGGFAR